MDDMGLFVSVAVLLFGIALGIALLLMPFYVIAAHGQLCKIRVLLEEMGNVD